MSPRKIEIEMVASTIVLNDVTDVRRVGSNVETVEDTLCIESISNRLVDEYRMRHGESELISRGPGLFDAPRDKDGRPGHARTTGKREAYLLGPFLNLLTERRVSFVGKLELAVLSLRGVGKPLGKC